MSELFRRLATITSRIIGSSRAFAFALCIIITWLASGPLFDFSDSWQLYVNTFTTITTFLIVILIQNTQNRDTKAIHLKLDELVRAVKGARLSLLDSEDLSDEELEKMHKEFKHMHEKYIDELEKRRTRSRAHHT